MSNVNEQTTAKDNNVHVDDTLLVTVSAAEGQQLKVSLKDIPVWQGIGALESALVLLRSQYVPKG